MSRIPPQGARMVGAWSEHTKPVHAKPAPRNAGRAPQAETVELVEAVMESAPAPAAQRPRHPHLAGLGRRLHLVH